MKIFFITLFILPIIFLAACTKSVTFSDQDLAVYKANKIYQELKDRGINFSDGPCLSPEIIKDWSVDIAHNPSNSIDKLPENNCSPTLHQVILDPNGIIISAK